MLSNAAKACVIKSYVSCEPLLFAKPDMPLLVRERKFYTASLCGLHEVPVTLEILDFSFLTKHWRPGSLFRFAKPWERKAFNTTGRKVGNIIRIINTSATNYAP